MAVLFATPSTVNRIATEYARMSAYAAAVVATAPALTSQQAALVAAVVAPEHKGRGHRG